MSEIELSVVIPAFNDAERLKKTLPVIKKFFDTKKCRVEIIIIDDGSKDDTQVIVKNFGYNNVRCEAYKVNIGKGYAVNYGVKKAVGRWILFVDADNSTPIKEIDKLWGYRDKYDVIIGSRYLKGSKIGKHQPLFRRFASRAGNMLARMLILPGIRDTQCGFKLFEKSASKEIFGLQTIWRWGFDMEILRIAREGKFKIKEVAVEWFDAEASRIQSKKVFYKTLGELFRIKFNSIKGKYKRK